MNDTPAERGAESTWARLRRRKVVQWGVAYAAGAWLLMQVLEYFGGTFHWPEQIQQLTTLALLIGLPIVLVLAWYHGDRGQQRISTPELAILTLLLLLGGGAFWYYQRTGEAGKDAAPTASAVQPDASTGIKDARPSVAVLPFENRSREADDAFFVEGIHDDILTQLSKVSALRVISRTSVERFRKTDLSVHQIAQQLGVRSILEGGVQRAGDRVRINVQLIDGATDTHVWAESYDRELIAANIFAIQSELAAAIAGALKATLTPEEKARAAAVPTRNLEAWESYQLGKQRMARRTSTSLADAERFFRKAVELDPEFALAHVGLADTLLLLTDYGVPLAAALNDAKKAIADARRLDPNLAEVWASSAMALITEGQQDGVDAQFQRAIELDPNYAQARHWYSWFLRGTGRYDQALVQIRAAADLDPLSIPINENVGATLEVLGNFADAETSYRKVISIDPSSPGGYIDLGGLNAYALNRFSDAAVLLQRAMALDSNNPLPLCVIAQLYLDLGEDGKSLEAITHAVRRWPDAPVVSYFAAWVSHLQADSKRAMDYAQRSIDRDRRAAGPLTVLRDLALQNDRFGDALRRYENSYPELAVKQGTPRVDRSNYGAAVDLALVLQRQGRNEAANVLIDGAARVIKTIPRLGYDGFGITDVQIHALRGETAEALAGLREAEQAGWRRWWRYHRDFDPGLASIRNEPEFKRVFADIKRDMARQRARLAARPKDAPLELTDASR